MPPSAEQSDPPAKPLQSCDRFLQLLLLAEAGLIAVTWPLWFSGDRFPAVPLLSAAAAVPVVVDRILTLGLCLSAIATIMLVQRNGRTPQPSTGPAEDSGMLRLSLASVLCCGAILVILNQHRLQPWHWLCLLILTQRLLIAADQRPRLAKLTVASIYLFAALSRLGPDIAGGMSRQILQVICDVTGQADLCKNDSFVFAACWTMAMLELLTGIALLMKRWRRLGIILAMTLHATLLLALSPWGLNHHQGVLLWNAFFLVAVPVLFGARSRQSEPDVSGIRRTTALAAGAVIVFPASGLFAVADNWPGWQLYSPRPEVVQVFVLENQVRQLPESVRDVTAAPALLVEWCPVRIDRWALAATQAPLYPEDRFQLAVAGWLAQFLDTPSALKVVIDQPQVPWWWRRRTFELTGDQLGEHVQDRFFFNAVTVRPVRQP